MPLESTLLPKVKRLEVFFLLVTRVKGREKGRKGRHSAASGFAQELRCDL